MYLHIDAKISDSVALILQYLFLYIPIQKINPESQTILEKSRFWNIFDNKHKMQEIYFDQKTA